MDSIKAKIIQHSANKVIKVEKLYVTGLLENPEFLRLMKIEHPADIDGHDGFDPNVAVWRENAPAVSMVVFNINGTIHLLQNIGFSHDYSDYRVDNVFKDNTIFSLPEKLRIVKKKYYDDHETDAVFVNVYYENDESECEVCDEQQSSLDPTPNV
jgi:hypothetical protein